MNNTTRYFNHFTLILSCCLVLLATSCKKSRSDIGKVFFQETRNKTFKDIDAEAFAGVFEKALEQEKGSLKNPKFITAFYAQHGYDPVLSMRHLKDGGVKQLVARLDQAGTHGLSPELFGTEKLKARLDKVYDKRAVRTPNEAYQAIAELEIAMANSLLGYSNALQYGLLSPRKIYAHYYTETKRPDSVSMQVAMRAEDLKTYLDSIQPQGKAYLALQKALAEGVTAPGMGKEETARVLEVNLERLRWKNRNNDEKMVVVNIPDFTLQVLEHDKPVLKMKVCVGEGRELSADDQLKEYDEDDLKKDRPFSRETPQLGSLIHSVQVNPVWNIPKSIATKEISKYAAADPYYLSNNAIDVFKDGQLVEDPETIDWGSVDAGAYSFKQRPGEENSLGKIKFLFNNQSSVYLHDTPNKMAFNKPMRAISHGCVRLEQPLELARVLFGEGEKLELIKREMEKTDNPQAKDIALPKKVAVYLTYFTCWPDEQGVLQFRKDVYGQDVVLYSYLEKMKG
ncbi:L,D-transpeptidase family protein [Pedobacter sp. JY14-1]|uniref:L,D-transpeptidase family protein n=1 Tax=Pedobacter sp. JY14-1 TaxID=3034151 RepID=UPI0023E15E98|nr:L,D-transpeptidase family protein [Pedobacter sp. JY14-1]